MMRPRKARKLYQIALSIVITALIILFLFTIASWRASSSSADGIITPYEKDVAEKIWPNVCDMIEDDATMTTVLVIVYTISKGTGLAEEDSVDVVNYSVKTYCPEHWSMLVALGSMARGDG